LSEIGFIVHNQSILSIFDNNFSGHLFIIQQVYHNFIIDISSTFVQLLAKIENHHLSFKVHVKIHQENEKVAQLEFNQKFHHTLYLVKLDCSIETTTDPVAKLQSKP
jgi:hypothetical protein